MGLVIALGCVWIVTFLATVAALDFCVSSATVVPTRLVSK